MIDVSGSYTLGGKTNRNLASQVEQNKRDIQYLLNSGLLPEGELEITENGEYDVKTKASVSVEVPQGIFPTGTKIITSNGSYDVETFKTALINVSGGVEPVGTKQITENGTYDIRLFANVDVQVPPISVPVGFSSTTISFSGTGTVMAIYSKDLEDLGFSMKYVSFMPSEITNNSATIKTCHSRLGLRDGIYVISRNEDDVFSNLINCVSTGLTQEVVLPNLYVGYAHYLLITGDNPSFTITEA